MSKRVLTFAGDMGFYRMISATTCVSQAPPVNEQNAYGTVLSDGLPVICMHGGSGWLCASCALKIYEEESRETGIDRHFREQTESTEGGQ